MTRTVIVPENDAAWHALRAKDITSTESSALFNMSPYATRFELWHRKRDGTILTLDENERMEWGTGLQDAIAAVLANRYGVVAKRVPEYVSYGDARMGASFDFEIAQPNHSTDVNAIMRTMLLDHGPGLFEIKAVDYGVFRDTWPKREDGHIEAPPHIEIQLQHQMHVRGNMWGALGVLVGGNKGHVIIRKYDPEVGAAIEKRVREFWRSIDEGVEPPPVYPGDEEFVCKLFGHAVAGKVADMRGNEEALKIVEEYRDASDRAKLAAEDKKIAQAKLFALAGDASRALVDGYSIDVGITKGGAVSYERDAFRRFKVNKMGAKK